MRETMITIMRSWAKKNAVELTTEFICQVFEKTYPNMTQDEFIRLLEEMSGKNENQH